MVIHVLRLSVTPAYRSEYDLSLNVCRRNGSGV